MSGAADRLLEAWRGEIEARAVYELIAQRERDPQRTKILRKMAEAESGHRRRLEARMRELGLEVPDQGSVRLSPWLRLQARLAPIDRLLKEVVVPEADVELAKAAGRLLAATNGSNAADAQVVAEALAHAPCAILTGDPDDIRLLVAGRPGIEVVDINRI